jgi:hypothetical protein
LGKGNTKGTKGGEREMNRVFEAFFLNEKGRMCIYLFIGVSLITLNQYGLI